MVALATVVQVFIFTAAFCFADAKGPAHVHWSIEAPGVEHSTATFDYMGVAGFSSVRPGFYPTFTTDFNIPNKAITATYHNLTLVPADLYGGAAKSSVYPRATAGSPFTVKFKKTGGQGINYFGYWLSSLDQWNQLVFYFDSNELFVFQPTDVIKLIGENKGYFGNPHFPDHPNSGEAYVFINFFLLDGALVDEIHFIQADGTGAGYESDNHTVGFYKEIPTSQPPTTKKTTTTAKTATKTTSTNTGEVEETTPLSSRCTNLSTCQECLASDIAGGCKWCQRNPYTPGICASSCYGSSGVKECPTSSTTPKPTTGVRRKTTTAVVEAA